MLIPLVTIFCALINVEGKKPNVLVILADDLGTGDIPGYYNDTCKVTRMKNIEKLVSNGVLFTDAHATPVCATSRYSFLSGNYQIKGTSPNGRWNLGWEGQFKIGQKSIADIFNQAGYNTAMMGKWHLGGKVPPNGKKGNNLLTHPEHDWSQAIIGGPQDIGFASSLITTAGIQAAPYSFFRDGILQTKQSEIKQWGKGEYSMPKGTSMILKSGEGDKDWDSTAYNMVLVDETKRFLDDHLNNRPDDPFFTYFATGSVHVPHSPPNIYDVDGTATSVKGSQFTAHMDMLFELDLVVGSLMKALEDRNLIEDTIIVFMSDNGGLLAPDSREHGHASNSRLRGNKGQLYEGGHTVPLIMRYDKGLPSGQTRTHLVGITDLYRTLTDMAGITNVPAGQAQDSLSFAKYARGEYKRGPRWNYGVWRFYATKDGCAIRTLKWKAIHFYKDGEWMSELFNIKEDPYETTDLSQNPPSKYYRTGQWLKKLLKSLGPCCFKGNCLE